MAHHSRLVTTERAQPLLEAEASLALVRRGALLRDLVTPASASPYPTVAWLAQRLGTIDLVRRARRAPLRERVRLFGPDGRELEP